MGKLPKNVEDAVEYADGIFDDCDNGEWQTIRAELHRLTDRLEAADALLRDVLKLNYTGAPDLAYHITEHLQGAGE